MVAFAAKNTPKPMFVVLGLTNRGTALIISRGSTVDLSVRDADKKMVESR